MARMVYISAAPADSARSQTLGLGFILDPSAAQPHALLQGAGQSVMLNEPFTAQQLATALQPILDAETAANAAQAVLAANQATLQSRATLALTANATFLAIGSPTNAQVLAQVQTLTKETTALIRLALGLLDSTAGT